MCSSDVVGSRYILVVQLESPVDLWSRATLKVRRTHTVKFTFRPLDPSKSSKDLTFERFDRVSDIKAKLAVRGVEWGVVEHHHNETHE